MQNPRTASPGDFVYSFYHQANVMVLGVNAATQWRPKILNTCGLGAPCDHYGFFNAQAPTIYHKNVRPHTWARVGEI